MTGRSGYRTHMDPINRFHLGTAGNLGNEHNRSRCCGEIHEIFRHLLVITDRLIRALVSGQDPTQALTWVPPHITGFVEVVKALKTSFRSEATAEERIQAANGVLTVVSPDDARTYGCCCRSKEERGHHENILPRYEVLNEMDQPGNV